MLSPELIDPAFDVMQMLRLLRGGESPHLITLDAYFATFGSSLACADVRSSTTRSLWR